ncbi:hypothetical protein B0J12DRAFT_546824, partial [Macrophomina phaseolina]
SGATKGASSDHYMNTWANFEYRKMDGVKLPTAQTVARSRRPRLPTAADLAGIHLPSQEDDSVEVYDPCDKLRKWINAYMKKPGVTQAQFCHDQPTMYSGGTKVADALLNTFRNEKSLTTGNTCPILCAGYVFVENMRPKENKPKSKFEEDMEEIRA